MSEYGFDYLTDRILFLEADEPEYLPVGGPKTRANIRPAGQRGRVGRDVEMSFAKQNPAFNKIYQFVGDTIKKGGERDFAGEKIKVVGKGGKRHRYRQLIFLVAVISELGRDYDNFDLDGDGDVDANEVGGSAANFSKRILGLDPDESIESQGVPDLPTLFGNTLKKIVSGKGTGQTPEEIEKDTARIKPYHDYINTETFKDRATNVQDILTYSDISRVASRQAWQAAQEREAKYGMGHEDIDRVESDAIPLVMKIKREHAAERRRTTPKFPNEEKLKNFISQEAGSSFVDNLYLILDALDNIVSLKERIRAELKGTEVNEKNKYDLFREFESEGGGNPKYDFTPDELEALYYDTTDTFERIKEDLESQLEDGIDFEDFEADLAVEARRNPDSKEILHSLMKEMNALFEMTNDMRAKEVSQQDLKYRGYNKQILDKFLQTPEDKKLFDEFYILEQRKRKEHLRRLLSKLQQVQRRDAGIDSPYLEPGEKAAFARGYRNFMARRGKGIPTGPEKTAVTSRAVPPKKLATKKAPMAKRPTPPPSETPEEDEEDYVMGYMTEQIVKDKRNNPRGEFKDRGFTKVRSYAEWLWLNQNK